jgi:hypothetical protein
VTYFVPLARRLIRASGLDVKKKFAKEEMRP